MVFKEVPAATPAPYVLKDENVFTLMVAGTEVATFGEVNEAALGFVMVHSILNLKYSRCTSAFGLFLQKVLDIDDGVKIPSKALNLLRRLD